MKEGDMQPEFFLEKGKNHYFQCSQTNPLYHIFRHLSRLRSVSTPKENPATDSRGAVGTMGYGGRGTEVCRVSCIPLWDADPSVPGGPPQNDRPKASAGKEASDAPAGPRRPRSAMRPESLAELSGYVTQPEKSCS